MREYKSQIIDIPSLFEGIQFAYDQFNNSQVWWRGQRDFTWKLIPSVLRSQPDFNERAAIVRFQQRATSRHPYVPSIDDRPSWLFLMQHYRLPTRLLDWTESPLIAAFFASEVYECHQFHPLQIEDSDGALYGLSPYILNSYQVDRDKLRKPKDTDELLMPEDEEVEKVIAPAFDRDAQETNHIVAVRPNEVDIRLMVQQSVFTINGYNCPLDDLDNSDEFLIKYCIPKSCKLSVRKELKRLGIRLSSIFPDLEHLAEESRQVKFKKPKKHQISSLSGSTTIKDEQPLSPETNKRQNSPPGQSGVIPRSTEPST